MALSGNDNDCGQITDAALAEGILRALEKSLEILEERRRTALGELGRPRATSKPRVIREGPSPVRRFLTAARLMVKRTAPARRRKPQTRPDQLQENGDWQGAATWHRILDCIGASRRSGGPGNSLSHERACSRRPAFPRCGANGTPGRPVCLEIVAASPNGSLLVLRVKPFAR